MSHGIDYRVAWPPDILAEIDRGLNPRWADRDAQGIRGIIVAQIKARGHRDMWVRWTRWSHDRAEAVGHTTDREGRPVIVPVIVSIVTDDPGVPFGRYGLQCRVDIPAGPWYAAEATP